MPRPTVIDGSTDSDGTEQHPDLSAPDPTEALLVLKDYLNISDPAVQQAVAELVAALARALT